MNVLSSKFKKYGQKFKDASQKQKKMSIVAPSLEQKRELTMVVLV